MAQHDYVLENASGALFRQDMNNVLRAIAENNMGATTPTTTYAGMWWLDTSTSPATLRIRNNANSAWVSCGNLNEMSYLAGVTSGIQTQLNEKAVLASPAFTGTPTAPTAASGTSSTQLATTAYVLSNVNNTLTSTSTTLALSAAQGKALQDAKAPLVSPVLTGTPTTPTADNGTKTTQIANTNFVAESKKVQYWSGTSRSYNTVYQASKSICVNVLLEGSYINGACLMTGIGTNTPTVIGQAGDDLDSYTKYASFWALIPAGMYWKVATKGYYAFEMIVITEYPFGE